MQFKSLRTHVALLVGLCILLVAAVLVGYATVSASRSQALVADQAGELLRENAEQRLRALAEARSEEIQGELEGALAVARGLANTNALMGKQDDEGRPRLTMGAPRALPPDSRRRGRESRPARRLHRLGA